MRPHPPPWTVTLCLWLLVGLYVFASLLGVLVLRNFIEWRHVCLQMVGPEGCPSIMGLRRAGLPP